MSWHEKVVETTCFVEVLSIPGNLKSWQSKGYVDVYIYIYICGSPKQVPFGSKFGLVRIPYLNLSSKASLSKPFSKDSLSKPLQ